MFEEPSVFFTAPWDPLSRRRGDPLGLRGAAEVFAELLAPGLTNATGDARWVMILSWCLVWSHEAWTAAGGGDLGRREGQRQRYAWLRPLELLWVARSLKLGGDGTERRQLPGRNAVNRWEAERRKGDAFGMRPEQLRRYRQAGVYGAYRTLFRQTPSLTLGESGRPDGWTPTAGAHALAEHANGRLPLAARLTAGSFEAGHKWGAWSGGNEARWWLTRGWREWETPQDVPWLPSVRERHEVLDASERELLAPHLFPRGGRRWAIVERLASAPSGMGHQQLCEHLAGSPELARALGLPLQALPHFTRLADAGLEAIGRIWAGLQREAVGATLDALAGDDDVKDALLDLHMAARAWLDFAGRSSFPRHEDVGAFAEAAARSASTRDGVRNLVLHHSQRGGGLRWMALRAGDRVEALLPQRPGGTSLYRFRLRQLARLAHQCAFTGMEAALNADAADPDDLEDGGES